MSNENLRSQLVEKIEQLTITAEKRKQTFLSTKAVIETLLQQMTKVDTLFSNIYSGNIYTGSYHDKSENNNNAGEFDFNLELNLPFAEHQYNAVHCKQPAGFVKYKLLQSLYKFDELPVDPKVYKTLFKEDCQHLSRNNVNIWMQSVADRALTDGQFQQIQLIRDGSSGTILAIQLSEEITVAVNLIPVIQMEHIPRSVDEHFRQGPLQKRQSFLTAIAPPSYIADEDGLLFRVGLSLPQIEKNLSATHGQRGVSGINGSTKKWKTPQLFFPKI